MIGRTGTGVVGEGLRPPRSVLLFVNVVPIHLIKSLEPFVL